jgi:hypothetical protein
MKQASITERARADPFDNAVHSHCMLAGIHPTLILRLLNQQQVARMSLAAGFRLQSVI